MEVNLGGFRSGPAHSGMGADRLIDMLLPETATVGGPKKSPTEQALTNRSKVTTIV